MCLFRKRKKKDELKGNMSSSSPLTTTTTFSSSPSSSFSSSSSPSSSVTGKVAAVFEDIPTWVYALIVVLVLLWFLLGFLSGHGLSLTGAVDFMTSLGDLINTCKWPLLIAITLPYTIPVVAAISGYLTTSLRGVSAKANGQLESGAKPEDVGSTAEETVETYEKNQANACAALVDGSCTAQQFEEQDEYFVENNTASTMEDQAAEGDAAAADSTFATTMEEAVVGAAQAKKRP
jgi:hypothetical protein